MPSKKKLLFLCTGNSCRSQIAEGWGHVLLEDDYEIYSAGIHGIGVNPGAIQTMLESGINISKQTSKSIAEVPWDEMDVLISLCDHAKESCPAPPPTATHIHWSIKDPMSEGREGFKKCREEIYKLIENFKATQKPS